eukprot:NODE_81_length_22758_cov_0.877797.p4 type:complete len:357 gc:universal NODE_81_length_22758_cov_0.877797:11285-12355(+)
MTHFFNAGPASLPKQALEECQKKFFDIGTGESILEISHRSQFFEATLNEANSLLVKLLNIPKNYKILWMQGGASLQFSACALNCYSRTNLPISFIVSGIWSKKAFDECKKLNLPCSLVKQSFTEGVHPNEKLPSDGFLYYCANETVHGVEFDFVPEHKNLICDMSSNFLSRPVDVSNYAVIFAGVQKNVGPAGATLIIVRDNLTTQVDYPIPTMLDYYTFASTNSLYNTPPVSTIFVCKYVLRWIEEQGGLEEMENLSLMKSKIIYDIINRFDMYHCPVSAQFRSRMNIPFRIIAESQADGDLEKNFIKQAEQLGLFGLSGHRSVGGIRASLYNAVDCNSVQALGTFMINFAENNK